ncbi:hypothetical protein [Clostridium sp.]|uniref:hypothetical protein n=1 Tax=Clostridium sp. TaxID=1506 RepID=UPI001A5994F9|nr:hypothetical protein [Clostridium sp.]MBK5242903.1 hypothetical protein [Clostridium sp.]
MKKVWFRVFVLVIISIVVINKLDIKSSNSYATKDIYNFLQSENNRRAVYGAAIDLNEGSSANTCVYFIAEVLRRNNFDVPKETSNTEQILSIFMEKGFEKRGDYENLTPGDICFTTDNNGGTSGFPTHTYVFMKWVKEGNYDYAYIVDNQAKDYNDDVYHIRNINVRTRSNGFDKDAFSFFMKKG